MFVSVYVSDLTVQNRGYTARPRTALSEVPTVVRDAMACAVYPPHVTIVINKLPGAPLNVYDSRHVVDGSCAARYG